VLRSEVLLRRVVSLPAFGGAHPSETICEINWTYNKRAAFSVERSEGIHQYGVPRLLKAT